MKCRHCGSRLTLTFLDLGSAPLSNAYLTLEKLRSPETWYPLRLLVCEHCWLVQTEGYTGREVLFADDYSYFSSFSTSWLAHAETYVSKMVERFELSGQSMVAEIGANDGYLLQYVKARSIPCYGVEPTASTAAAARRRGLRIVERFFDVELALELKAEQHQPDLIVANNVLAHVPDINNFVRAFSILLKPKGVATFEFPHLPQMVRENQFDTAYHEHYSYLSLTAVERIFTVNGLAVFDVEQLPTHGGSLRVFAERLDEASRPRAPGVTSLIQQECAAGLKTRDYYLGLQRHAEQVKDDLLFSLIEAKRRGLKVGGYGAAAKGNTLLNFAGIRPDLLPYVADRNPAKQGKYMPGSRIPIVSEQHLQEHRPDQILILPWNIKNEVIRQLSYAHQWGGQFVIPVPSLQIIESRAAV
ncbi:MAG: SAM-dependent methyltransferase [Acidobacteria bacterium]|nr:MAG: SAM-dependent methyltransferase [Acidobacteriota bacterium]